MLSTIVGKIGLRFVVVVETGVGVGAFDSLTVCADDAYGGSFAGCASASRGTTVMESVRASIAAVRFFMMFFRVSLDGVTLTRK